jgi:hypothetical protein
MAPSAPDPDLRSAADLAAHIQQGTGATAEEAGTLYECLVAVVLAAGDGAIIAGSFVLSAEGLSDRLCYNDVDVYFNVTPGQNRAAATAIVEGIAETARKKMAASGVQLTVLRRQDAGDLFESERPPFGFCMSGVVVDLVFKSGGASLTIQLIAKNPAWKPADVVGSFWSSAMGVWYFLPPPTGAHDVPPPLVRGVTEATATYVTNPLAATVTPAALLGPVISLGYLKRAEQVTATEALAYVVAFAMLIDAVVQGGGGGGLSAAALNGLRTKLPPVGLQREVAVQDTILLLRGVLPPAMRGLGTSAGSVRHNAMLKTAARAVRRVIWRFGRDATEGGLSYNLAASLREAATLLRSFNPGRAKHNGPWWAHEGGGTPFRRALADGLLSAASSFPSTGVDAPAPHPTRPEPARRTPVVYTVKAKLSAHLQPCFAEGVTRIAKAQVKAMSVEVPRSARLVECSLLRFNNGLAPAPDLSSSNGTAFRSALVVGRAGSTQGAADDPVLAAYVAAGSPTRAERVSGDSNVIGSQAQRMQTQITLRLGWHAKFGMPPKLKRYLLGSLVRLVRSGTTLTVDGASAIRARLRAKGGVRAIGAALLDVAAAITSRSVRGKETRIRPLAALAAALGLPVTPNAVLELCTSLRDKLYPTDAAYARGSVPGPPPLDPPTVPATQAHAAVDAAEQKGDPDFVVGRAEASAPPGSEAALRQHLKRGNNLAVVSARTLFFVLARQEEWLEEEGAPQRRGEDVDDMVAGLDRDLDPNQAVGAEGDEEAEEAEEGNLEALAAAGGEGEGEEEEEE